MQRNQELASVLVEEQHLDEPLEHHEPVSGGISLVVDDLVLFEFPERHVACELPAIDLGKDLDWEHVGERAGHLPELFDLHERQSLGAPLDATTSLQSRPSATPARVRLRRTIVRRY